MPREFVLDNADIVLSLLRSGYSHTCARCERGMHVRYASGLCVWCYNEQMARERAPRITRSTIQRAPDPAPAA